MKEVISLEDVPFDIPNHLKNKDLVIKKMNSSVVNKEYYYISSPHIYTVYSYEVLDNYKHVQLITEVAIFDVFEAIEQNSAFKNKIESYLGN